MISRACRIATLSAGIDLSLIGKGETLNRPADVLAAIPNPGRDNPVPVGGFIQEWWAASSRYGGRHNLGIVGGFVRNHYPNGPAPILPVMIVADTKASGHGKPGQMEIVLTGGERILVWGDVETAALARVLKAMVRP
jgi:hypothetical protein